MNESRYDISGPGIVRAIQEATSANKDIEFAYDYDSIGRLLRIGYCLKNKGTQDLPKTPITWFSPNEIQVSYVRVPTRDFKLACLDDEYLHTKENERHFL